MTIDLRNFIGAKFVNFNGEHGVIELNDDPCSKESFPIRLNLGEGRWWTAMTNGRVRKTPNDVWFYSGADVKTITGVFGNNEIIVNEYHNDRQRNNTKFYNDPEDWGSVEPVEIIYGDLYLVKDSNEVVTSCLVDEDDIQEFVEENYDTFLVKECATIEDKELVEEVLKGLRLLK